MSDNRHATFEGFHLWTKSQFEKLGWMLLTKHHYESEKDVNRKQALLNKLNAYKEGVKYLYNELLNAKFNDPDKQEDIRILRDNVETLMGDANRILRTEPKQEGGAKRKGSKKISKKISKKRGSKK